MLEKILFVMISYTLCVLPVHGQSSEQTQGEVGQAAQLTEWESARNRSLEEIRAHKDLAPLMWAEGGRFAKFLPESEIVGRRDRTSKHFRNPDGTRIAVISGGPVHRQDEYGVWREIHTELQPNQTPRHNAYDYTMIDGLVDAFFGRTLVNGFVVSLPGGEVVVSESSQVMIVSEGAGLLFSIPRAESDGLVSGDVIRYEGTYPMFLGSDHLQTFAQGVKHNLVIDEYPVVLAAFAGADHFVLRESLRLPAGWSLVATEIDEEGRAVRISIVDAEGIPLAELPPPRISESVRPDGAGGAAEGSGRIQGFYEFGRSDIDASYNIDTYVPLQWLLDPDRQYPVTIDPTIIVKLEACNSWEMKSSTNCSTPGEVRIRNSGTFNSESHGAFRWTTSSIPNGATINWVDVEFRVDGLSGNPTVVIRPWECYRTFCSALWEASQNGNAQTGGASMYRNWDPNSTGWWRIFLPSQAAVDLKALIFDNCFGVALEMHDSLSSSSIVDIDGCSFIDPNLFVSYTVLPDFYVSFVRFKDASCPPDEINGTYRIETQICNKSSANAANDREFHLGYYLDGSRVDTDLISYNPPFAPGIDPGQCDFGGEWSDPLTVTGFARLVEVEVRVDIFGVVDEWDNSFDDNRLAITVVMGQARAPNADDNSNCGSFTVQLTAVESWSGISYDWQYREPGNSSNWRDFGGTSRTQGKFISTVGRWNFRCRVRFNGCYSAWSVREPVEVLSVPGKPGRPNTSRDDGCIPFSATITATTSSSTYDWFFKAPGFGWAGPSSQHGSQYSTSFPVGVTAGRYEFAYRVRNSFGCNSVLSDPVFVWVYETPGTPQPPGALPSRGCDAVTVNLSSTDGQPSHRWQVKEPGGSWQSFGSTGSTESYFCDRPGQWEFQVMSVSADGCESEWSNARIVTVTATPSPPPTPTSNPPSGEKPLAVTLSVAGSCQNYRWQWKSPAPGAIWVSFGGTGATQSRTLGIEGIWQFKVACEHNGCRSGDSGILEVPVHVIHPPTISSLNCAPDPVRHGDDLTLTAFGVADSDGTVSRVVFYFDTNGNNSWDPSDEILGEDTSSVSGWTITTITKVAWGTGTKRFFARAQDNDLAWTEPAASDVCTVNENAKPRAGTLACSPASVLQGDPLTLTVTGASDSDGFIERVEFYRDSNGSGSWESSDQKLGEDTTASNGWIWTGNSDITWGPGTVRFFAHAFDNDGARSDNAAFDDCTLIANQTPVIQTLSCQPNPVLQGQLLTLTAVGVADADGTVVRVVFYHDTNGNKSWDPSDAAICEDTTSADGWSCQATVRTHDNPDDPWPLGSNFFFARAQDNAGAWTDPPISAVCTIEKNDPPVIAVITCLPLAQDLGQPLELCARGVIDPDGTIERVSFYRDLGNGMWDPDDEFLGDGTTETPNSWCLTVDTSPSWPAGSTRFFARAQDDDGAWTVNPPGVDCELRIPPCPVNAATGVRATDGRWEDKVLITWIKSSNAKEYYVYRSESGSFDDMVLLVPPTTKEWFIDTNVVCNVEYFYRVGARNPALGLGDCETLSNANAGHAMCTPVEIPSAPTSIVATDGLFKEHVLITWFSSTNSEEYELWRSTTPSFSGAELIATLPSTWHFDRDVSPGQHYWYWVKACNSFGCSPAAGPNEGWIPGECDGAPEPPTGVRATNGRFEDRVLITWLSSPDGGPYEVWRSTDTNFSNAELVVLSKATWTFDLFADPGTHYWYWVMSCNECDCSVPSGPDEGWIPGECMTPEPPTGLRAWRGQAPDRVLITWFSSTNSEKYELWRSTTPSFSGAMLIATLPSTWHFDSNVSPGQHYWYWVKGCNNCSECSSASGPAEGWPSGGCTEAPPPPTGLVATKGRFPDKVLFTWLAPDGAESYEIWRSTDTNFANATMIASHGATWNMDSDVSLGVSYFYWVKACAEGCGCGNEAGPSEGWAGLTSFGIPEVDELLTTLFGPNALNLEGPDPDARRKGDRPSDADSREVPIETTVVLNDDYLSPLDLGDQPVIDGHYIQTGRGELGIEIAGLLPIEDYDMLVVRDYAVLDGRLVVWLTDGFEPQVGDAFVVVMAWSLQGSFTETDLPNLVDSAVWSVRYECDRVVLTVDTSVIGGIAGAHGHAVPLLATDRIAGEQAGEVSLFGDLTGDNLVDVDDVLRLIETWGDCAEPCVEDLNTDGVIDALDLDAVLRVMDACF